MTEAIRIHETGGPEVMSWETVDVGAPAPGQVRLRHTAVGVNFIDIYYRTGLYPEPTPFTPGREGVGIVEAVGDGVATVSTGDRVAYAAVTGSYCEARLIAADMLVRLPDHIDDDTAAAVTLQGMTARYLIKSVFPIRGGETILVHAAAGGVGLLLCQWASALGATVIGTVSTDAKADLARSAGCCHTIVIPREDLRARVADLTDGVGVPVVFDSIGRDTFDASLDCLRRRGTLVVFGQSSGVISPIEINLLSRKGSLSLTRPVLSDFISTPADLETVASDVYAAVGQGILTARIGQEFALRDAAEAHRAIEARQTTGSTILRP